jgi:hypothetical protein
MYTSVQRHTLPSNLALYGAIGATKNCIRVSPINLVRNASIAIQIIIIFFHTLQITNIN